MIVTSRIKLIKNVLNQTCHFKRECPKRKDWNYDKMKNNRKHNEADDIAGNACFSCIEAAMVENKDDRVLADSGASCHIFNDMAWFTEFEKKKEILNLAGKYQLNSAGKGKIAAEAWINGLDRN